MATLTFLGAAGTVTGPRYLFEAGGERLMVDCGLFQGQKELRLRNWADLPVPARSIRWLVLAHGHLDHTGYIPRLVRQGFRGPILASAATFDLAKSPMAIDVTTLYLQYHEDHNLDTETLEAQDISSFSPLGVHFDRSPEESKALNDSRLPTIEREGTASCQAHRSLKCTAS